MDDEILTVFERFEVVWPLDVADGINGPTSASTELSRNLGDDD